MGLQPGVRFVSPVDASVGARLADHLVAVLREALTKMAKHAKARRVDVILMVKGAEIVVVVTDDGIGIDPDGFSALERISPAGGTPLVWQAPLSNGGADE